MARQLTWPKPRPFVARTCRRGADAAAALKPAAPALAPMVAAHNRRKGRATPRAGLVLPKGIQQRAHDKSISVPPPLLTSPSEGPLRLRSTRSYRHALSAAVFAARERPGAFRRRGTPVIR